jgi:alpha-L-rhamnosidase
VTELVARIAKVIGKAEAATRYNSQASKLLEMFREEYVTPAGRLVSDTQTAYALTLHFGLLAMKDIEAAKARMDWLTRWEAFKITTGFSGTPIVLQVLADNGMLNLAYRMLQERDDPSWLYPVGMGATTIVCIWLSFRLNLC